MSKHQYYSRDCFGNLFISYDYYGLYFNKVVGEYTDYLTNYLNGRDYT